MNRTDEALKDFNKAIELRPTDGVVYYSRALVYFLKKDYLNSWKDATTAEKLGYFADSDLLDRLKKKIFPD